MLTNNASKAAGDGNTDPDGGLLSVSQVAKMLNAHPNSVRRWADMGLLPAFRVGCRGDRFFLSEDVASFLGSEVGPRVS